MCRVSSKFSRMTSKSNYESFSDSDDGEIKGFKSIDEIDGRAVYMDAQGSNVSSHQNHVSAHRNHVSAHQSHVSKTYQSQHMSRSSRSQF